MEAPQGVGEIDKLGLKDRQRIIREAFRTISVEPEKNLEETDALEVEILQTNVFITDKEGEK